MATIDTVKEVLNETLDLDTSEITEDTTFDSLEIDSLDMVEVTCELEERCEIELGELEGIDTLGKLVAYIDSLK